MGKFQDSLEKGKHALLLSIAGNYTGRIRTWFEKDQLADDSAIEGSFRPVLDGRFLVHEYQYSFEGKAQSGISLMGYDLQQESWQTAWADSFHMSTAIMFSTGSEQEHPMVLGAYGAPGSTEQWGWRTVLEQPDGKLRIQHFNISPDGAEALAVQIDYDRISSNSDIHARD